VVWDAQRNPNNLLGKIIGASAARCPVTRVRFNGVDNGQISTSGPKGLMRLWKVQEAFLRPLPPFNGLKPHHVRQCYQALHTRGDCVGLWAVCGGHGRGVGGAWEGRGGTMGRGRRIPFCRREQTRS
jgi:hypothetical protein